MLRSRPSTKTWRDMKIYSKDDFSELFTVSDDIFKNIEIYHGLLVKWNKAINLVSPKSIPDAWHRHFIDSAQVTGFVPENTKVYADLGCGGGFPGLVVAIMRPDIDVHLVESDERKCQFMRTVVRECALNNVTIHISRVENVTDSITPDFITARALASLEQLFTYCLPWAQSNHKLEFCFMKGMRADEEIGQAYKLYNFDVAKTPSITDPEAQLLTVKNLCMK